MRAGHLALEPLCRACAAKSRVTAATDVDHIDGDDANNEPSNLQSLCHPCHSAKTARENGGFGRAAMPQGTYAPFRGDESYPQKTERKGRGRAKVEADPGPIRAPSFLRESTEFEFRGWPEWRGTSSPLSWPSSRGRRKEPPALP
ncbi:HNH endonuclease signature motif containing protein [Stenotrophomonas rhizophila]|uniref:HNH endonuclease signature motif containing protein n=1 Tax=Stenotrophomonas rhizophila TaxID=216778 RepID=UPI003516F410